MEFRTPIVSPLRQCILDDVRMRKLQPRTHVGYIRAVRRLTIILDRAPDTATAEDLRSPRRELRQGHTFDSATRLVLMLARGEEIRVHLMHRHRSGISETSRTRLVDGVLEMDLKDRVEPAKGVDSGAPCCDGQ